MADDIEQVRRAEMRRGRRPVDLDAIQERQRISAALREILNHGTLDELKDAMRVFGLSEKMPQWIAAVKVWNAERAQH